MACEQMFTFQSILNFLVIKHHSCNAELCCLLVISMGISMREANDILLLSVLVVSSNFSPGNINSASENEMFFSGVSFLS